MDCILYRNRITVSMLLWEVLLQSLVMKLVFIKLPLNYIWDPATTNHVTLADKLPKQCARLLDFHKNLKIWKTWNYIIIYVHIFAKNLNLQDKRMF